MKRRVMRSGAIWTAGGIGLLGAGYAALAAAAWARYGHVQPALPHDADDLLDRFMPVYEAVERHQVQVDAPPVVTLLAAQNSALDGSRLVRTIFKAREVLLGAIPPAVPPTGGLLARMTALGWRVLAEVPGHEVVLGAVTQPWMPNVVFRGVPPEEFKAFCESGYVKIVWTLRADTTADGGSVFRTETRVATTDAVARRKFRWYWARFSPGIAIIRRVMTQTVKRDAERLVHRTS